jgi:predicted DNA-binding transcriptional regulator AlpA
MPDPIEISVPKTETQRLLRPAEVAEFLNVSPRTLEAWRHRGGGPPHLMLTPRCCRYELSSLLAWQRTRERQNTSDTGQGRS